MRMIKIRWSILFIVLWNSLLMANSELIGSIEGDVQVNSGIATYSLPINTPKASKGYTPSLSVNYRQGSGNSPLGLGFSLGGLSSIAKCTTTKRIDDVKGGIAFSQEDKYCLDGARLIQISNDEYRLYNSKSLKVKRHGLASNPDSWTVWGADGYINEYGKEASSQVTTTKGTINWKISSKRDRFNNITKFNYIKEGNSVYIDTIIYQQYKVKFNYEKREDKIVTYAFGTKMIHEKLLKTVQVYSQNALFYTYKMSYSSVNKNINSTRFSKLKEVTYCDKDNQCLKPVTFEYAKKEIYNDVDISAKLEVDELLNYVVADMNRDGFNDVCYYNGALNCAINKGDGTFEASKKWTNALDTQHYNNNQSESERKKRFAISSTLTLLDLNNDTYVDYCVVTLDGVFCGLNSL